MYKKGGGVYALHKGTKFTFFLIRALQFSYSNLNQQIHIIVLDVQ